MLSHADLALYADKVAGRGRVQAFKRELSVDESYRRVIERELRSALLLDELDVN